jgi:hypothetical protein
MVKQSAISNPQAIVDAYSDKVNGSTKKVVALALSKGLSKSTPTKQPFCGRPGTYSYSSSRTKTNRQKWDRFIRE